MRYCAAAETDMGGRPGNEDSLLIKHAATPRGEALLCVVCDGMGGLACGEVASASVVRAFGAWFDQELPRELSLLSLRRIARRWCALLDELNGRLARAAAQRRAQMGTTFSGILFVDGRFLLVHAGDSRIYRVAGGVDHLTHDDTMAALEAARGTITWEEALTDSRRSILTQGVGVSDKLRPQVVYGRAREGAYLLCSDGFHHGVTDRELSATLRLTGLTDREAMRGRLRALIETDKARGEQDNISAVLVRAEKAAGEKGPFRELYSTMLVHLDETI